MYKRSAANYSLWPERRQRRGGPLKFVAGSFVLGVLCAAAYGALFNFAEPATGQGFIAQRAVEPVPIVLAREPRPQSVMPLPSSRPADFSRSPSRARTAAAKVTLPLIGAPASHSQASADPGSDDGLVGEVSLTGAEPATDAAPSLLGGSEPPVSGEPATKDDDRGRASAFVPLPRAAPPRPVAGSGSVPPTTRAPGENLSALAPNVTRAPAAKTGQGVPIEVRSERRGVVVLTRRMASADSAGDDAATSGVPAPRSESADGAPASADFAARRRGYVVVKPGGKPVPVLARGDGGALAAKPRMQSRRPRRVQAASIRQYRAPAPRKVASRKVSQRNSLRPTRYAATSRPKGQTARRPAIRRRHDQLGPMIARANQLLRAFAGSQGLSFGGF